MLFSFSCVLYSSCIILTFSRTFLPVPDRVYWCKVIWARLLPLPPDTQFPLLPQVFLSLVRVCAAHKRNGVGSSIPIFFLFTGPWHSILFPARLAQPSFLYGDQCSRCAYAPHLLSHAPPPTSTLTTPLLFQFRLASVLRAVPPEQSLPSCHGPFLLVGSDTAEESVRRGWRCGSRTSREAFPF